MKFSLVCFLLISISISQVMPLELANFYYEQKNYSSAILEYKRYLYFNNNKDNTDIYRKLYESYKFKQEWDNALDIIDLAYQSSEDEFVKDKILIDKGKILIAKGDNDKAEILFTKLLNFSKFSSIQKEVYFFIGLCNLYSYKWIAAKHNFTNFYGNYVLQTMDSIFSGYNELKIKSPSKARFLSLVVPGAGQFYARDYKNGINSFLLNILTSYFLVNSIVNKNYFDAYFIYFTPFERYYNGGKVNAGLLVERYNEEINQHFANSIFNKIIKLNNE